MSDAPCHNCGMPLGAHGALHHCAMYLADESDPRDEEITRLRARVKDAFREGFCDANDRPLSDEELDDEWRACWEISTARQALQETGDAVGS